MLRSAARSRAAVVAAALGAVLLLGACAGPAKPGAAAVVGDQRLSDAQVADAVDEVTQVLGGSLPAGASEAKLNREIVNNWMRFELIAEAARREGITHTQGEIDALISQAVEQTGSREELLKSLASQGGTAPSQLEALARFQLDINALVTKLGKGDENAGGAALQAYVEELDAELDPQVSPRFGTWDAKTLTVGLPPTDLAAPPGASSPTPSLLPEGATPTPSAS